MDGAGDSSKDGGNRLTDRSERRRSPASSGGSPTDSRTRASSGAPTGMVILLNFSNPTSTCSWGTPRSSAASAEPSSATSRKTRSGRHWSTAASIRGRMARGARSAPMPTVSRLPSPGGAS
ncbi:hypothetical protein [Fodinicola feengrottensis]|uniref:hypothetical protein n=1 Tax=Fodinicola feengrottensis TaxID=435914 RepID=UPI0013D63145|nr:hypothetical protein [Fodinicola feengrottensis]